jgi:ABC-type multidrug transport system ATPase subunit
MPALSIKNLSFTYPKPPQPFFWLMGGKARSVNALKSISLALEEGEKVSLMGRNGAGKTTLLKIVMGLLSAPQKNIGVFGRSPLEKDTRRLIGFSQSDERSFYFRLTVRENLLFFGGIWGIENHLLKLKLDDISERLSIREFIDEPFAQLSSGMKQRVSIARSMLHDPPLLLLDEPTRSLDAVAQAEVGALIKSDVFKSKAILLATHKFDEALKLSRRCVVLREGTIVLDGSPPSSEKELIELLGKEE